jgi:hypothetical protein
VSATKRLDRLESIMRRNGVGTPIFFLLHKWSDGPQAYEAWERERISRDEVTALDRLLAAGVIRSAEKGRVVFICRTFKRTASHEHD